MQTTDLAETYAYGTRKDLVKKKRCNNIINRYKND